MATSVTHTQTRSVVAGPLYRVVDTATASVDIEHEVFVFVTDTQAFSRVATVDDMLTLPDTQAEALSAELGYYRLATVTRDFEALTDAKEFAASVNSRLKSLCVDYAAAVAAFIGSESTTVIS